jgi:hypothetical protein
MFQVTKVSQKVLFSKLTKQTLLPLVEENSVTCDSVTTFLGEFKVMFQQLIYQNNMVINMLTMLMSKMNNG